MSLVHPVARYGENSVSVFEHETALAVWENEGGALALEDRVPVASGRDTDAAIDAPRP